MSNPSLIDSSLLQYAPWQAYLVTTTPNAQVAQEAFRPPAWANTPPDTYIEDPDGNIWIFDAVIKLDHTQSQRITEHPIQSGANKADHSFSMPAQLSLEISMSDAMSSYVSVWGNDQSEPTKSVMAYQTLLKWKNEGVTLFIFTRLDTYVDMVVQHLSTPDDKNTLHGLKCMATFRQIFTASILSQKTSLLPHDTDITSAGDRKTGPFTGSVGSIPNAVVGAQ